MVRLAGVRPVGEGGWSTEGRLRLHQVLNESGRMLEVKTVNTEALVHEVELKFIKESGMQDVGDLLVEEGFAHREGAGIKRSTSQAGTDRSSDASGGEMMSNFLVGEKEEFLCDETGQNDEIEVVGDVLEEESAWSAFINAKVILTGMFDKSIVELNLVNWAEQLWGKVDHVKIGYNQIHIAFSDKESADICLKQGRVVFEGIVLEVFQNKLRFINGIHVHGLVFFLRKTDVMEIFSKFGDIAFIEGPFVSRGEVVKHAVVVFKDRDGMEGALNCSDMKYGGKRLIIKRNTPTKIYKKMCESISQTEECMESSEVVGDEAEEVEVTHVESPGQIYIRLAYDYDRWSRFHQELQEVGEQEASHGDEHKLATGGKVLCRVESVWHRGTLMETGKICLVRLVDVGMEVRVDIKNVRKVEDKRIIKERVFAKLVSLSGIEPAGSGRWSDSSVDLLRNITRKKKVILFKKAADQSVDLLVEDMTSSNPLDVETVVRTSIADILMEKGLALKKDTRSKCARTWNGFGGNSPEDVEGGGGRKGQ